MKKSNRTLCTGKNFKYHLLLLIVFALMINSVMLAGCRVNAATPPKNAPIDGERKDAPTEISEPVEAYNTIELSVDLINSIKDFLYSLNLDVSIVDITLADKFDMIKNGAQPLHVKFDPTEYYYVCAYFDGHCRWEDKCDSVKCDSEHCEIEKATYCCHDEYVWVGFGNEKDIPEYYNGGRLIAAFQVNKTLFNRDLLSEKSQVPKFEYYQMYQPTFIDGFNVADPIHFEETFIYLNVSEADTVYYGYDRYRDKLNWEKMSCVEIDGEFYLKHQLAVLYKNGTYSNIGEQSLRARYKDYYDYLISVMIADKYSETYESGNIGYYGLFKLEDIAKMFK